MIDPFTAVAAATTAFNTVKKFVHAGQDFENCMGQMGKWYSSVSDFRKGQQMQKNPPIFKKLLASGSVEEEALNLLIHEKKVMEMEKELQTMLNFRFGFGTWNELKEMQRKIRAKRDKEIYRAAEARQAFINGVALIVLLGGMAAMLIGIFFFIAKAKGLI
jgi:CHASE3 domain sensor protein